MYRRRLPHWHPDGQPLFLTWRLHGSLPPNRFFPTGDLNAGKAFVAMDRLLDKAGTGPLYLARPEIARLVVDALVKGQDALDHYDLHAFVVMANHVHVLIAPKAPIPKLLQSLKGSTARQANQILGLTGRIFWQSYGTRCETRRSFSGFAPILRKIRCMPAWLRLRRITPGRAQLGRSKTVPG